MYPIKQKPMSIVLPVDEWRAIEIRPRSVTAEAVEFINRRTASKQYLPVTSISISSVTWPRADRSS